MELVFGESLWVQSAGEFMYSTPSAARRLAAFQASRSYTEIAWMLQPRTSSTAATLRNTNASGRGSHGFDAAHEAVVEFDKAPSRCDAPPKPLPNLVCTHKLCKKGHPFQSSHTFHHCSQQPFHQYHTSSDPAPSRRTPSTSSLPSKSRSKKHCCSCMAQPQRPHQPCRS